jgi:hypothetical protein
MYLVLFRFVNVFISGVRKWCWIVGTVFIDTALLVSTTTAAALVCFSDASKKKIDGSTVCVTSRSLRCQPFNIELPIYLWSTVTPVLHCGAPFGAVCIVRK